MLFAHLFHPGCKLSRFRVTNQTINQSKLTTNCAFYTQTHYQPPPTSELIMIMILILIPIHPFMGTNSIQFNSILKKKEIAAD